MHFIASTLRKDPREDLLVRIASLAALLFWIQPFSDFPRVSETGTRIASGNSVV